MTFSAFDLLQTFSKMSAMVEDTNEVPHADYGGDLLAGDEVKIFGPQRKDVTFIYILYYL